MRSLLLFVGVLCAGCASIVPMGEQQYSTQVHDSKQPSAVLCGSSILNSPCAWIHKLDGKEISWGFAKYSQAGSESSQCGRTDRGCVAPLEYFCGFEE